MQKDYNGIHLKHLTKYSEDIEALGQSIQFPIETLFSSIGAVVGLKYFNKAMLMLQHTTKNKNAIYNNMFKYFLIVFLSVIPSIGINAYITKEQKKASRVADMISINELNDYKDFV